MNSFRRPRDRGRRVHLPDGARVRLRRLREGDLAHANEFFAHLSERSRYLRFMMPMPRLTPETLGSLLRAMHETKSAVVVAVFEHADGREELLGGGRIVPAGRPGVCEFALTVVDEWHGRGLGRVLLRELVRVARELGYRRIEGHVLAVNSRMLALAQRARMQLRAHPDDPAVITVHRTLLPFASR